MGVEAVKGKVYKQEQLRQHGNAAGSLAQKGGVDEWHHRPGRGMLKVVVRGATNEHWRSHGT